MSTATTVSRANRAIKEILRSSAKTFTFLPVVVREVDDDWRYDIDGSGSGIIGWSLIPKSAQGGWSNVLLAGSIVEAPFVGEVRVLLFSRRDSRRGSPVRSEIIVPRIEIIVPKSALDAAAISVATDMLLAKNKRGALAAIQSSHAAEYRGIATAIAEANAKTFTRAESESDPSLATKRGKKTKEQLEREIAVALERRTAPSHLRKLR